MKFRKLLIGLLIASGTAQAVEPLSPPGLLPIEVARPLLEQDPGVASARAGLEVARQQAGILERSPHEWNISGQLNQRHLYNADKTYSEWNANLQKGIRLPNKAAADRRIGKATVDESFAVYGAALIQSSQELIGMWVDWLAAERGHELAKSNLKSAQANLDAVEKRSRAGDASQLDVSLARAELADQRRLENDAKTQADATWSLLSTRFPGLERRGATLPEPLPIKEEASLWRQRVIGESHALQVMQARTRNAQAQADRARADKIPDPTLGVYSASENGHERVFGLTFSVPIPTGLRSANSAKALAAVEVSRQDEELAKRQLEAAIAGAVATARGSYESMQIAKEGAASMQENAKLMQRAYALGEAELQAMLIARRQANAAQSSALQAQVAALKAYYGLLADAQLIWGLDSD